MYSEEEMLPIRLLVLASGRGSNFQALLDAWQLGELPVAFVGLGSDQPGAEALERACRGGVPTRVFVCDDQVEREGQILDWVKETGTQLLALAGYMRLLSGDFIKGVGVPILNIHPSLLPRFPGLHAQRQALEAGVQVSGCTVHFVDEGMDTGPVILQREVPVLAGDDEERLSQRILAVEHQAYPEAVRRVCGQLAQSAKAGRRERW